MGKKKIAITKIKQDRTRQVCNRCPFNSFSKFRSPTVNVRRDFSRKPWSCQSSVTSKYFCSSTIGTPKVSYFITSPTFVTTTSAASSETAATLRTSTLMNIISTFVGRTPPAGGNFKLSWREQ